MKSLNCEQLEFIHDTLTRRKPQVNLFTGFIAEELEQEKAMCSKFCTSLLSATSEVDLVPTVNFAGQ